MLRVIQLAERLLYKHYEEQALVEPVRCFTVRWADLLFPLGRLDKQRRKVIQLVKGCTIVRGLGKMWIQGTTMV